MRELAQRVPVAVPAGPDPARHADLLTRLELLADSAVRPARPRWGHRLALMGVAVALLAPFGVRLALDAVEGVGYLDEPTGPRTACTSPRSCAAVCGHRRRCGSGTASPGGRRPSTATTPRSPRRRHWPGRPTAAAWPSATTTAASPSGPPNTLAAMRSLAGYHGSFRATGMGWSPDGTRLAAVDGTGTLQGLAGGDGAAVGATPVFTTYTGRVAWSPRSDAVAVRTATRRASWRSSNGSGGRGPGAGASPGPEPASSIAWAPDGTALAAGYAAARTSSVPARRRRVHAAGRRPAGRPAGDPRRSPDGTAIATTSTDPPGDGVVRVFDGRTGAPTGRFPGQRPCSRTRAGPGRRQRRASPTAPGSSRGPCTARRPGRWESPQQPYGSRVLAWTADGRVLAVWVAATTSWRVWRAGRGRAGRRVGGQPVGDAAGSGGSTTGR